MQGVSESIKRVLAQVGIEVALKPYFTLSSLFRKPKDVICDEKKCGLVYEIPCRDCDAVYVGETGRSLSTRKKEHVKAVKEMNLQKSALCQHIVTCDHFIAWDNASILKIESHYRKRRISLFCVLSVKCREMYILKFLLTFRLAIDARLHQKTELRAENRP